MSPVANDFAAIAQRLKEIQAEVANAHAASKVRRKATGVVLICGSRIMELRISRRLRRAVNDDGAEVVDVRESRAGAEETARALEKAG